jgi:diguanylate cyclase (GGDEF)-like protein
VAAILPINLAGSQLSAWKIGSRIRVTGICSPEIDTQNHVQRGVAVTKSFRILLRSPADITLLERPSWWTPAHAIVLLALALIATLATLGWVVTLRRRVEHQAHKLRESEQLFRHMAMHDTLTGLATRRRLQERLDVAVEDAKRRGTGLAVLMVDLDGFKEINDTYGHPAGDEVLRETANRLSRSVRREDTVARLGGDEFVVLLRELTDLQAAERIASIIVGSLAEPIAIEDYKVRVSASVGVCAIPAGAIDAVDLLKNADEALYHAKTSGRNRFQVYRPGITAEPTFT